MKDLFIFFLVVAVLSFFSCSTAHAQFEETRYCGPPPRDLKGVIVRSTEVPRIFQRIHPCPPTGAQTGACTGWAKDHVIPLACGGCDAVHNMQWLDTITKARKDRFERRIYARTPPIDYTPACRLIVTPAPP